MDHADYRARAQAAADLAEQGEQAEALDAFAELTCADLPAVDRGMMALNAATLAAQLGDVEGARSWYRVALDLEDRVRPTNAREYYAAFLSGSGDPAGAIQVYRELLVSGHLDVGGLERVSANLAALGG